MSHFTTDVSSPTIPDPSKRVHYVPNAVLGVDEFQQEQAHLLERDRLHTRALHGYGTVHGLRVALESPSKLFVTPGLGVVPSGQHVCVGRRHRARLDEWVRSLDENDFEAEGLSPPAIPEGEETTTLPVYVVLCYRERETDADPLASGPTRAADDPEIPTRIAEDFELQLRLTPPAQASEAATRAFGAFLRRIQITEHEELGLSAAGFEDTVDAELETILSQIKDPDDSVEGSGNEAPIRLPESSAHVLLRRALQRWSMVAARGVDFSGDGHGVLDENDGHCLRLGRIDLPLREDSEGWVLGDVSPEDVSHDERPVVLESRLLQEYLVHGSLDPETVRRPFATVSVEGPRTLRLWVHHDNPVQFTGTPPLEVDVNGKPVAPSDVSRVEDDANAFDVALGARIEPGARVAVRVRLTTVKERERDKTLLDRLVEGDVQDYLGRTDETATVYTVAPFSSLRLDDLAGVDVPVPLETDEEQLLVWKPDESTWTNEARREPGTLALAEVASTLPTLPFATADVIHPAALPDVETPDGATAIRVRFHLNTHETSTTVENAFDVADDFNVQVFSERDDPMSSYLHMSKEQVLERAHLARNVFVFFLPENIQKRPYLRLRFDLSTMTIRRRDGEGQIKETYDPATKWIEKRPVKWLGHDGTQYVTVFATWSPPTPAVGDLSDVNISEPSAGDVPTWVEGTWVAQKPYVQTNTETKEQYAILAAGRVFPISSDGYLTVRRYENLGSAEVRKPVYGGLEAELDNPSNPAHARFKIRFDGYDPDIKHSYVVNGTIIDKKTLLFPHVDVEPVRVATHFMVVEFQEDGIVVQSSLVHLASKPDMEESVQGEGFVKGGLAVDTTHAPFMVEISRFVGP